MEKEISTIKEDLGKILDVSKEGIVFAKKYGKRNEFQFKIGNNAVVSNEVIFENKSYIVFGENIDDNQIERIKNIFDRLEI